jgi:hypothetical protein
MYPNVSDCPIRAGKWCAVPPRSASGLGSALQSLASARPQHGSDLTFGRVSAALGRIADLHRRPSIGRSCEGFRMPAGRDERAAPGPASESRQGRNPRGAGLGVEVYGDLTVGEGRGRGRRLARRRRSAAWSAGRSRQAWRNGRALAPRSAEVGAIGGPGRRIDRMRVRSTRRRRRGPGAGLRCEEGFSGVMRPRL